MDRNQEKLGIPAEDPENICIVCIFDIDSKGLVYVLDPGDKKAKVYSGAGIFLRDFPLTNYGTAFRDIDFYNNNLILSDYIMFGNAEYNWIVIDTLGNLISQKKNPIPAF